MGDSLNEAIKDIDKRDKTSRRQKLISIIDSILSGTIDSKDTPLAKIFDQGPRQQFVSPNDRGTHNYGYMEVSEMNGES